MTTPAPDPLDAPTAALAAAVLEVARHVGSAPLPVPRLFALARSAELMAASPALASLLGAEGASPQDDLHLTPIDLDEGGEGGARPATDPLAALEAVQWPDLAAGGAIACDLPPSAWFVRDPESGTALPDGKPLRVVVAALADGTTWSAVQRDGEDNYVLGAALLPEIARALVQTLQATD